MFCLQYSNTRNVFEVLNHMDWVIKGIFTDISRPVFMINIDIREVHLIVNFIIFYNFKEYIFDLTSKKVYFL